MGTCTRIAPPWTRATPSTISVITPRRPERAGAHGVADLERAGLPHGCVQRLVDRAAGDTGARVGRAQPAVALGLGLAGLGARGCLPPPLLAARRAQLLAQRLELAPVRGEIALRLAARALPLLRDGGRRGLGRRALCCLVPDGLLAQRRRLAALSLGLGPQPRRGLLGARGFAQQPFRLDPLRRQPLAGSLDHGRVEPEPPRDLEGVRRPRPSERERVGGSERLGVEAHGAVERPRRRACPLLDLGVVGRRDRERRALRQLVEQGARECRALDRIGARGDLVEQHERARRGRLEHVDEVAQVARERRERGGDRLLVADVGQHVGEDGKAGALGRDEEPALVEQRTQPERLQRDRLAAGVGAAEDEHPNAGERQIDRHDGCRVEQRMPCGDQLDVVGGLDRAPAPAPRERAACECEVDGGQHLDGMVQLVRVRSDMTRELGEDARDLVALVALELAQPVRQLDDRERLDEQRLPGVARVVDDPGHRAARARAHGDHRATAALGDEVLLQVRLEVGIRGQRAQPIAGAAPRGRELGAQRLQLGRGGVLDARRVQLQRALQHIHNACECLGDLGRALGQQGRRLGALGQVPADAERRTHGLGDCDQRVNPE